jgi:hypothetical protein
VFDELYLSFTTSICDGTKRTILTGYVYDFADYGGKVPATFEVFKPNLREASVEGLEVPVYSRSCTYYCIEICYAEIFEYGTCPPEPTYVECYENCEEPEFIGNAAVSVSWKMPTGTNTPLEQSSYSYSRSYSGYSESSSSKGSYRYDIPVTISATLNGENVFSSSPSYDYGYIANTNSKSVTKTSSNKLKY